MQILRSTLDVKDTGSLDRSHVFSGSGGRGPFNENECFLSPGMHGGENSRPPMENPDLEYISPDSARCLIRQKAIPDGY